MKNFFVITNGYKDPGGSCAAEVAEKLRNLVEGARVGVDDIIKNDPQVPADTDAVIVLGGDGTLLKVAIAIRQLDIPILGVNLGNMGYLTEVELSELDAAIERLKCGDFLIEKRMMLAGSCCIGGVKSEVEHALNDIVMSRLGELQISGYRVTVNGIFLGDFFADGIVICTPTGSTGYSLSAGGPIVEPSAQLMVLTAVASHSLKSRSIVLSEEDHIRVELLPARGSKPLEAGAYFDGVTMGTVKPGDYIEVRRSSRVCRLIKLGTDGFLQVVQKKLS